MAQQKYPVGIQTFSEIREDGYLYIDKTDLVFKLVDGGKYYFLSRPRRFGKSLLLSTIEAYFLGQRNLFKGLAIDTLTDDWNLHPVFHIDLSGKSYLEKDSLPQHLKMHLAKWENIYGDEYQDYPIEDRFLLIIEKAFNATGKKVVVLIDEYDKPLLDTLDDEKKEIHNYYREVLRGFYGCLKRSDRFLRFVMLTGVTKFSQVSIFSGLNNLLDISLDEAFSTICGITPQEITDNLSDGVKMLAERKGIAYERMLENLRDWYDGYHFASDLRDVYNPFSLMSAFTSGKISNYWFQSGNPDFLIKKLKNNAIDLFELQKNVESGAQLQDLDLASANSIPLMFQSGYLTIKAYDDEFDEYTLGYPNREVKQSLLQSLVPQYTVSTANGSVFNVKEFTKDVKCGDIDSFMKRFQALFAGFPYDQVGNCELHYHNVIYLTFVLMGFYVRTEYKTSDGRCDAVVMTDRFAYIFEFKYDRTAEEALRQINEKEYHLPFSADGKEIIKIGVNFSSATRRIDDIKIEKE